MFVPPKQWNGSNECGLRSPVVNARSIVPVITMRSGTLPNADDVVTRNEDVPGGTLTVSSGCSVGCP